MKIVVLDGYALNPGDTSWEDVEAFGDLKVYDRTGYDQSSQPLVIERAAGAEIILTNKTPVHEEAMEALPDLKYIGVLATGYNIVDVEAAKKRGIIVSNIPTYGTASVAQMAIALMLELCHHVGAHSDAVKNGEWSDNPDWSFWKYPLVELDGKTLGIVGFGKIGQRTAHIAKALGMEILVHTPHPKVVIGLEDVQYVTLEKLFNKSDFISLHCPLNSETAGMINKESLLTMKDGVRIINTSRGRLIVEEDLVRALEENKVGGAALDVVSAEPIKKG
jgi:glycerate dehydrogenase